MTSLMERTFVGYKQIFPQKIILVDLDAIVIGSGIGGLTTAVTMAKAGKKVLVLEQHDQVIWQGIHIQQLSAVRISI